MPRPATQKQSLGRRSKFGSNHLEKLGPSSGYEHHHRETDRWTEMSIHFPALSVTAKPSEYANGPSSSGSSLQVTGSLFSPPSGQKKKKTLFLALPSPKLARQRLQRSHPPQTVLVTELWVRMFAQTPHGIVYLEGCQLEKC